MEKLSVTLETVTQLFLGGAKPNERAELRAPSIKGAMRFWYRAIDPDYKLNEPKIFGSIDEGQGAFFIRLKNCKQDTKGFKKDDYKLLTRDDSGKNTKNGMRYLGFSLETGKVHHDNYQQRKFINAGETIEFDLIFRKNTDEKTRKSVLASLWLLGHIGGLGSRSRRGFGTVALQSLNCQWQEARLLPIAHKAKSADEWLKIFKQGRVTLKDWFQKSGGFKVIDHTVLGGNNTKFYLFRNGKNGETETKTVHGKTESKYFQSWEMALNEAGLAMQGFRQRWEIGNPSSDYPKIKAHLAYIDSKAATEWGITANKLSDAPQRAAFGLPLTFQSSYQDGFKKNGKPNNIRVSTIFEGERHERNASPIHIRIININGACHPLYIRLDAPFLEDNEKVKDSIGTYKKQATGILDVFWNGMKINNSNEVIW